MYTSKNSLVILDPQEQSLGFLNPDKIHITETHELYKLRTLEITHPLNPRYDTILKPGNKIWQQKTSDNDSCLYVIRGPKSYNHNENTINLHAIEAAVELGQYKATRANPFTWKINNELINKYFYELFSPGIITPNNHTITYNGVITPLAIINEIQSRVPGEFQYRYNYNPTTQKINRYIDYLPSIGSSHPVKIELDYNASEIKFEIDENNTAIGALPLGENADAQFHIDRTQFEQLTITRGQKIPLYYNKNEKQEYTPGPLVSAPYTKYKDNNYIVCDNPLELKASYNYIQTPKRSLSTSYNIHK